jgi:hypothetical protein
LAPRQERTPTRGEPECLLALKGQDLLGLQVRVRCWRELLQAVAGVRAAQPASVHRWLG